MSSYYYFMAEDAKEYFELCSGSWSPYMEELQEVVTHCVRFKKSYKDFIRNLKKQRTFLDFYDSGAEFINEENQKYFLRPLFDWVYKCDGKIELIDDGTLYDRAVWWFCQEKGLTYRRVNWGEYAPEIEQAIKGEKDIIDKYLKLVGKLFFEKEDMREIGVNFEHALAELKKGATIWRKGSDTCFWLKNGGITNTFANVLGALDNYIPCEDILAEDWDYSYEEGK